MLQKEDRIEVHCFGVVAEKITPEQLVELGEDGYGLIDGWNLNEKDYGPNQRYFIFSRLGDY